MITADITFKINKEFQPEITEEIERVIPHLLADALLEKASENLINNGSVVTGKTLQSGVVEPGLDGSWIVKFLGASVVIEFGSRAHIIEPKDKKALAFPKFGGRRVLRGGLPATEFRFGGKVKITDIVFAKKVHHPGTDPRPFMRPAIDWARAHWPRVVEENLPRYLKANRANKGDIR